MPAGQEGLIECTSPSAGALIARARQGQPTAVRHWLGLLAYAVGFAVLALWGYRRDEGTSYR